MNKQVFVVYGSEDGILGVYTTLKRAWNRSVSYIQQCDDMKSTFEECKGKIDEFGVFTVYGTRYGSNAEINQFEINH